jgi:LDH2 family malate/lactate/ureidoglycolate dehydrogenase
LLATNTSFTAGHRTRLTVFTVLATNLKKLPSHGIARILLFFTVLATNINKISSHGIAQVLLGLATNQKKLSSHGIARAWQLCQELSAAIVLSGPPPSLIGGNSLRR